MRKASLPVSICLVALLVFFVFKVLRFQSLNYSFNDMYSAIQMGYSWMDGRPLLYENVWGFHHKIHNYYMALIWGPLARAFGAYGLFMVQSGLLMLSYVWLFHRLTGRRPSAVVYTLLFGVMLGPIWFWLNDHPNIGWHNELGYLPLAVLLATSLSLQKRELILLSALAVLLVKEDGAVLGVVIHAAYVVQRFLQQHPLRSIWQVLVYGPFWAVVISWTALFVLGMWWLAYKNDFAEPRLQIALKAIAEGATERVFWKNMLGIAGRMLLLLLPLFGALLFLLYQIRFRRAFELVLLYLVGIFILTALNFVQSAHYYGEPLFHLVSLTWPPRFVLPFAFTVAYLIFVAFLHVDEFRPTTAAVSGLVIVGLFLIQIPILYVARPDFITFRELKNTLRGRYAPSERLELLNAGDMSVLQRLAATMPPHSNVFAFDYVMPLFHKHYGIWPTGKQWQDADVAIIPIDDFQKLTSVLPMKQPYRVIRLNAYNVYVKPAYEPYLNQSLRP